MKEADHGSSALGQLGVSAELVGSLRANRGVAARYRADPERCASLLSIARAKDLMAQAPTEHLEWLRGVSQPAAGLERATTAASWRLLRVQSLDDALRHFALRLSSELAEEINLNAYFSPEATEGLAAHADPYDVIAIQLAGRKRWELYGENVGRLDPDDCVLAPGDVLVVPTGLRHRARSLGPGPSLHLTIGIFSKTDRSVVEWISHELTRGVRKPLTPTADPAAAGKAIDEARAAVLRLVDSADSVARFLDHRRRVEYERTIATVAEHRSLDARGYR